MIISIGKSRRDTRWHNVDMTWETFLKKLETPHRSHETAREYKAMSKAEKGVVKDVGGFVGGELKGDGHRKAENVVTRSMVTLDLDNAGPDAWEDTAMWGWTCACYSTHSHTPENPRLRLVFPLNRAVGVDEYQAIARRVAEYIGIEQLDPTSYEPSRLMYWPSCSSDGEYVFKHLEGTVIDADEILRSYGLDDAWKDSRLWPVAKTEETIRIHEIKRQGNPTEKPGIVGLFCRAYDIHEAIATFLPEVYMEGDKGRYTYAVGSTADGAVVYEDGLFLYSHHGTDPCGGQLVNAFDLVRIHRFGDLDGKSAETDITKRPSYKAMCELATNDHTVKRTLAAEKQAEAEARFIDLTGDGDDGSGVSDAGTQGGGERDDDWVTKLQVDKKGAYLPTVDNIILIILNDPNLAGKIRYNEFDMRKCTIDAVPWDRKPHGWTDADDAGLRWYLEKAWNITGRANVFDGIELASRKYRFHPVREYLNSLVWDGTERLDTMLIDFLEADDTRFARAATRKWMVAACKRVFEPGCKFDNMIVVVSPQQGKGKSMLGDVLGGQWFAECSKNLETKDAMQNLLGRWIVEMGEMSATKKSSNEAIKQYITCRNDVFRGSYERYAVDHPRQCVFIGSTNSRDFIIDETGGRRFWPIEARASVETAAARIDQLKANRDQLWAEAMVRYKDGEKLWMDTPDLMHDALVEQETYTQEDEWIGMVQEYLDRPLPDDWDDRTPEQRRDFIQGYDLTPPEIVAGYTKRRDVVSIAEIRYELLREDLTKGGGGNNEASRHLGRVMNVLTEWEKGKSARMTMFGKQKVYVRVGARSDILRDGRVWGRR